VDPAYYKAHDTEFIVEDKKEETLKGENMKANVQVIEYNQLLDIKSNDVNNSLLDPMNQEIKSLQKINDFATANAVRNKTYSVGKCHFSLLSHNEIQWEKVR